MLARAIASFSFRVPSWRFVLTAFAIPIAKWLLLWAAADAALSVGRYTPFGPGVLGAIIPLLALEAWVTTRRHWRTRLFHTLGFAVPAVALVSLFSAFPGSCCFCDQRPWARTLRTVDFLGDGLYFSALATLPAFALLIALRRRSSSSREDSAYTRTTVSALLATLCAAVSFGGTLHAVRSEFPNMDHIASTAPLVESTPLPPRRSP